MITLKLSDDMRRFLRALLKNEIADITQELKSAEGEVWRHLVRSDLDHAKRLLEVLQ